MRHRPNLTAEKRNRFLTLDLDFFDASFISIMPTQAWFFLTNYLNMRPKGFLLVHYLILVEACQRMKSRCTNCVSFCRSIWVWVRKPSLRLILLSSARPQFILMAQITCLSRVICCAQQLLGTTLQIAWNTMVGIMFMTWLHGLIQGHGTYLLDILFTYAHSCLRFL